MKQFEYMYFFAKKTFIVDIQSKLNAMGADGWRRVDSWDAIDPTNHNNDVLFWLEREIVKEA